MTAGLSSFSIEDAIEKLSLTRSFEFETRRALDDCIHKLRLLQPNHDWNIHFGGPRTIHEVVISQFDDQSCYYDVSTMYRGRRSGGYSRTANVSGKLQTNPETGGTIVSGQASLNLVSIGLLAVVIVFFLGFVLFAGFPLLFGLFGLGALGYAVYGMYADYTHLLRIIHEM